MGKYFSEYLFFSVVLLNKTDLVKKDEINQIKSAIKVLNPKADIATTQYSKVNLDTVINTKKFNMDEAERSAGWLQSLKEELKTEAEEYGIGSFIYRSRYIISIVGSGENCFTKITKNH